MLSCTVIRQQWTFRSLMVFPCIGTLAVRPSYPRYDGCYRPIKFEAADIINNKLPVMADIYAQYHV